MAVVLVPRFGKRTSPDRRRSSGFTFSLGRIRMKSLGLNVPCCEMSPILMNRYDPLGSGRVASRPLRVAPIRISEMEFRLGISAFDQGHSGRLKRLSGCSPSASVFRYLCPYLLTSTMTQTLRPATLTKKAPLSALDTQYCFLLGYLPRFPIVESADVFDAFVRIVSVGFVDAFNLEYIHHLISNPERTANPDYCHRGRDGVRFVV
jgi:hypothetical protein